MKRMMICTAAALLIAVAPAAAKGGKGGFQGVNANVNVVTGKGGLLGALVGTLKGGHHKNGLNVNANVTTGKGGILGTILGGR